MDGGGDATLLASDGFSSNHVAINSQYAAFSTEEGISFCCLGHDGERQRLATQGGQHTGVKPTVALLPLLLNRIAVSSREQLHIYDLDTGLRIHGLPGNGRVVSTLAWSPRRPDLLAAGTIDGRVCVWDVTRSTLPLLQLRCSKAACSCISLSPLNNVLATAHAGLIIVWSLRQPDKPIRTIYSGSAVVTHLAWHPNISGRLLSVSADRVVRIWEVAEITAAEARSPIDEDSDDEGFFGELDGLQKQTFPIAQLECDGLVTTADWVGEHGLFVLLPSRSEIRVYSLAMVKFNPQALIAHSVNGSTSLTAVAPGQSESYRVPSAVLDNVGGHAQPSLPLAVENFTIPPASSGFEPLYRATKKPLVPGVHYETFDSANLLSDGARMKPVSIAQLRAERGSFAKTSKQLQKRRRVTSSLSIARGSAAAAAADAPASPATPASRATTSSLELPKTWDDNDDDESPMPFLSPGIPARKPSPNTAPRIEESTDLPSLQSTSFESLPSTVGQDSDSDDETFTGGMRNSSTFMPGGINVPLPKACGALFAPNGQLLTFFPPKPRPPSIASNRAPPEERADHRSHTRRIAQLFPVFGNLTAVREMPGDGTDDEQDIDEYDPDLSSVDHELPSFAMHPSSFQSQSRWSTHASPTKPAFNAQDVHRILVSVHEVDELTPSRRAAAYGYRNICKRGETKSNLCRHNADVAESVGLEDTAIVWRLMALLLEEKVPLSTVGAAGPDMDVLFVARQATSLLQAKPSIDPIEEQAEQHGKLRWADSPLGAAFLVRKCFQWAERRADVQLLALLSAVFIEAEDKVPLRSSTASHSMLARLPTHVDRIFPGSMMDSTAPEARPIPLLRNESNPSSLVYASPTQLRHCSQASSRTPSQPPTPHIGSASSTPPLSLPSFSRESSKFSGSASPEHHRSSFSAAARHYAQSITDKFASYGTSPPLKTSTSPSFNELSTSLSAAAAGSWSKSVSFASTASTTRDSQLNRSYTSQDLDGYDSDKTIDDTSLPHTPKLGLGPVVLHLPNSDMFTNDVAGGSTTLPLMPSDLAAKATSWRAHYAEQLRCWGLWMQAAELEKAAGMTLSDSGHSSPLAVGFIPVPKQRKATCSICFAVITRLAQICSACSHTTHVDCLDDYIATLEDDETFECPTGCGCACDRLPYEPIELTLEKDIVNDVQKTVRRKVSYTDPRRWRARVEGESW